MEPGDLLLSPFFFFFFLIPNFALFVKKVLLWKQIDQAEDMES